MAEGHETLLRVTADAPGLDVAGGVPGQNVPFVHEQAFHCSPVGVDHLQEDAFRKMNAQM